MYFQKPPLGTPLDWSNPLNKGVVGHWAFNEGNGDKVQDLSMHGNHGTLTGMAFPPTTTSGWNPGRNGVGLNFDGVNDYVDCGNNPILQPSNGFTVCVMVKQGVQSGGSMHVIAKRTAATGYYIYFADPASPYIGGIVKIGGVSKQVQSGDLDLDRWYSVMCTHDGAVLRMYIDGVQVNIIAAAGSVDSNTSNLNIGARGDGSLYSKCSIDECHVLNRVYTAKEVLDYYINPYQVYLDEDD